MYYDCTCYYYFQFWGAFEYGGTNGTVLIDGIPYEGAGITSIAFAEYIPFSNVFLTVAVVLFAVSTMFMVLLWVAIMEVFVRKRQSSRPNI